ncbi:hypothetical protein AX768_03685 [Burkholderia sp. PAMC 28687]|nr:hypothetical protein AX768_03685 [Burkholderia sp. PAMC 28687]
MRSQSDRIWDLVESLEDTAPPLDELKRAAWLCGTLEAAGRLLHPTVQPLWHDYKIGVEYFVSNLDKKTARALRPFFYAGFTALLVCADEPLSEMRDHAEVWR